VQQGSITYYPTYDGNGNVSQYIDLTGNVVAHYEYDPFGNTTFAQGSKSNDFAHRFSTKPLDATTGLYYYGYRFYDPETGRWPSRDPIEEWGGVNLYGFIYNNPTGWIDILGNGPLMPLVAGGFATDVAIPEPSDVAWPKWAGWGAAFLIAAAGDAIIDAVNEAFESANNLDIIKQQSNEINKEIVKRALEKIKELKNRKNPHPEKGKKCKDSCLYVCFALRRVEEIKKLRELTIKHPIPNDPFDHVGQLKEITTAVANRTKDITEAKCKCDLIPHGF
jgi:RHS repeat-associated protein